ncbi:MAG: hypothetical protein LBC77_00265 [Spirochaetaceae bacterium]|nr:hypothetical protein [Spirochaetaceae bacterium]
MDYFLDIRYKGNMTCPHCGATVRYIDNLPLAP